MYSFEETVKKTSDTLLRASTVFSDDKINAYREAIKKETDPNAKWVLENILENARSAENLVFPLCDDTGLPHALLEIGDKAVLPAGILRAIEEGVADGLRKLPGRPMGIVGNDRERIGQTKGMSSDSGDVALGPIQLREIKGSGKILLTVMMMGGGPEIQGKTIRVFHRHSTQTVLDEMVAWATEGCAKLGCLPAVLGFGIGRTNVEAASLSFEAMAHGDFSVQSDMEREITQRVNESGIGPLGLGGKTTALATFLKVGAQRSSGVRIVSLRVGCCFDPRKATTEL